MMEEAVGMIRWYVRLRDFEDVIDAPTRSKAVYEAVRRYKAETGDDSQTTMLVYFVSCTRVDGRKKGVRRLEAESKDSEVK